MTFLECITCFPDCRLCCVQNCHPLRSTGTTKCAFTKNSCDHLENDGQFVMGYQADSLPNTMESWHRQLKQPRVRLPVVSPQRNMGWKYQTECSELWENLKQTPTAENNKFELPSFVTYDLTMLSTLCSAPLPGHSVLMEPPRKWCFPLAFHIFIFS